MTRLTNDSSFEDVEELRKRSTLTPPEHHIAALRTDRRGLVTFRADGRSLE